ncbi:N-acetylmuramoyl-L-alanine amidase [Candidatus Pacearchaeota archaeon]|nr:N-acetylmuramoyl-L-alanine amidase [Candidatus Pacearchaeota archaeon]
MILISAGHHPNKAGACFEDFCEFDEAARWAKLIHENIGNDKSMLVPFGVLRNKVAFINERSENSIAVEIHFNSAKVWKDLNENGIVDENEMKNVGRGALTLHYPNSEKGRMLATEVQLSMEPFYGRHWNGVMEGYYRMNKKYGVDYFLAKTHCPSIIIEPEFIHHKELIQEHREVVCFNIAQTLLESINE